MNRYRKGSMGMQMVKRFAVTILGFALLTLGVAMMVLPGPGILIIVAGLAVLATEYVWARRLLTRAKREAAKASEASVASPARTGATVLFGLALAGLGLAMLVARELDVPFWSPITGGILIVTGLILLATTYMSYRSAHGDDTTYTGTEFRSHRAGSVEV